MEGNKIIFRDKIDENGKRYSTYELVGIEMSEISDLTEYMNKKSDLKWKFIDIFILWFLLNDKLILNVKSILLIILLIMIL